MPPPPLPPMLLRVPPLERSEETVSELEIMLQRIAFFGLAERFEESVELLAFTFGWSIPRSAASARRRLA